MRRVLSATWLVALYATTVSAAEVSGRVAMPEVCAPAVSPAVVTLRPIGGGSSPDPRNGAEAVPADVALINQRGMQFVPRVQAITLGQTLRFTNEDTETHNVHVGNDFNESMSPGQPRTFTPSRRGVYTVLCDVHSHMRGFVIVADTPWVRVCSREGRFRFDGVPEGRYRLDVWHELGTPLRKEVVVARDGPVDLATMALTVPASVSQGRGAAEPALPWSRVIERIGLLLASSLDAAGRPDGLKTARKLAEDAYWGEFEKWGMETAVRIHLGFARTGALEGEFRGMIAGVLDVAHGRQPPEHATALSRKLLLALLKTADELNRKGVTDKSHIFGMAGPGTTADPAAVAAAALDDSERQRQLTALKRGFAEIKDLADRGEADEAASAMTTVYFEKFEPLESYVAARKPQDVSPLELRFSTIRGEVGKGLKGEALAERFAALQTEVETALGRSEAQPVGTFGTAFVVSLVTILREGAEVILLLAMLIALVVKSNEGEGKARALRAIAWGVGLAAVASLGTAVGLNRLVASSQAKTRELVEGLVMLAASGVLFYVSYWLISQSESRRWMDFLKRQARRGSEIGGRGTLVLTAFLAVYREGAETALMYQALLGSQGQSRPGLIGLAVGLGVGLVALAVVVLVVRATSVRVPLRAFFQASGAVLFGLAVVFAGNAIFELQQYGLLKTTTLEAGPFTWLGQGIPMLGLYPNVQTLSVQGLLLAGAALSLLLLLSDRSSSTSETHVGPRPTARAGV